MSELQFSLEYYSGILKAGLPAHVGGSGVVTFSPYLSLCPPYERSLCRQTLLSIAVHSLLHLFMSEGLVAIISSFESRSLSSFNFADPFLLSFFFYSHKLFFLASFFIHFFWLATKIFNSCQNIPICQLASFYWTFLYRGPSCSKKFHSERSRQSRETSLGA